MKKIKNWTLVLVMILTAGFTLTSCDPDQMQANDLEGQWKGNFSMYYTDQFGYEWKASWTVLEFYQDMFSNHGTGRQYDYYYDGPFSCQYYRFEWRIDNGVLYMTYPGNPNLNVTIYDYRMSSYSFTGNIGSNHIPFYLEKSSEISWSRYDNYGNYYYEYKTGYTYDGYYYDTKYHTWGYSKTRSGSDSAEDVLPPVKIGNYAMEGAE